ncbi:DMT family transporter [Microbacterium trichothecenolyticum]|uniref:Drug/metabolite transporter (DMT)-like permease n=1 Tax=Microbacterium trichothecenolyticum TaxID=69370 RepID=A0ABU0TZ28_MICTR|nr:DMT family transporter [Microbacterium trichothecenolyticum]MDQ1124912.1 drug/metabolite transporter (DMT)-like permease [Microbacterium trichothecenolyticum]
MTTFALARRPSLSPRLFVGGAALAAVVTLWAAFALSTRALETAGLTTVDAALARFAVPALLLSPFLPRTVRALRTERPLVIALVLLAGLPHFLLFAEGAHLTSAALTGLLVPGTVPLFVAILLFLREGTVIRGRRLLALLAVVAGVAASALLTGGTADIGGICVLVTAGLVWALYTLGLARTRLDPIGVILIVSVTSTIAALALATTGFLPSRILAGTADLSGFGWYALVQGVGTGLLSTACYVIAVKNLGSSITATAGALSPVLTAAVAVPLLHEPLTSGLAIAMALIAAGVAVFTLSPATASDRPAAPKRE